MIQPWVSKGALVVVMLQALAVVAAATLGMPVAAAVSGGSDPVSAYPNLTGRTTSGQNISINTDARSDPLHSWEAARLVTVPPLQQWPSLWVRAPGFATSLPSIYVLDRTGKLRMHTTGRVPAEVWDTIAELL